MTPNEKRVTSNELLVVGCYGRGSAGRRYLLFLTYIPSTKAYSAVNHESSFDITDTRVETLSEAMVRPFAKDLREFITSVKTAIAAAQRKGGAQ